MEELAGVRDALDRLHTALDDLAIRGLRSAGPQDLVKLSSLRDEFRTAGAGHIAERLTAVLDSVRADDRDSAAVLLRAMTAARLFDRFLTLEHAADALERCSASEEGETEDEEIEED